MVDFERQVNTEEKKPIRNMNIEVIYLCIFCAIFHLLLLYLRSIRTTHWDIKEVALKIRTECPRTFMDTATHIKWKNTQKKSHQAA